MYDDTYDSFLWSVCTGLTWDKDGDTLAIGNEKTGTATLFNKKSDTLFSLMNFLFDGLFSTSKVYF